MASSMVVENWDHADSRDNSESLELSQINQNLLMSLLDETQIDDCDDERLTNVIRSLEAEINSDSQHALDNVMCDSGLVDCQSSNDELNSQDRSLPYDNLDLHWMDMDTIPSSPSGAMGNWYMDHNGQGMLGGGNEFGGVKNYSNFWNGTLFEEQYFGSLWHGTNVIASDQ